jgi:hypothetical protein
MAIIIVEKVCELECDLSGYLETRRFTFLAGIS